MSKSPETTEKQKVHIPPFNDHGGNCKGHANFFLDCTYENKDDQKLLIKVMENYYGNKARN